MSKSDSYVSVLDLYIVETLWKEGTGYVTGHGFDVISG
jgi:hypothetical protein